MSTLILGIATALIALLLLVSLFLLSRRGASIGKLQFDLDESRRQSAELQKRLEEKSRQADDSQGKLEKSREEVKRLKKKMYELESQPRKPAQPEPDSLAVLENELLESRAQVKREQQAAQQARAETEQVRDQVDQLKKELLDQKKAREEVERRLGERMKSAGSAPTPKPDTTELDKLKSKLEAARRKARTDAQVYRVTNSKLQLAMEKIASLEKRFQDQPAEASGEPAEGAQNETRSKPRRRRPNKDAVADAIEDNNADDIRNPA